MTPGAAGQNFCWDQKDRFLSDLCWKLWKCVVLFEEGIRVFFLDLVDLVPSNKRHKIQIKAISVMIQLMGLEATDVLLQTDH